MLESIRELKEICRKKHKKGVTKPHWWASFFARKISIYITWLLVRFTNISANQVTIWQLIASLIGLALLCFADIKIAFIGALFLQLGYVFDNVDGEVARYRKTQSINGMFLDFVNHEMIIPMTFGCLAFHYYFITSSVIYFGVGLLIILFKINPIGKARKTTINYLTTKRESPSYDIKNYSYLKNTKSDKSPSVYKNKFLKKIKSILHNISEYPNDVIIITLLLLLEVLFHQSVVGEFLILIYLVYLSFLFVFDLWWHLRKKVVERDFTNLLQDCEEINQSFLKKK